MRTNLLIALVISSGSMLIPTVNYAEEMKTTQETPPTATETKTESTSDSATQQPKEMPKDAWLSNMTPLLPDLICKAFMQDKDLKKRFDEIKMNEVECAKLIPESTNKCQNELYAKIPDMINESNASTWGRSLGECIGKDFAIKYLIPKTSDEQNSKK